jgi:3-isopropylmalate dehydrogenase
MSRRESFEILVLPGDGIGHEVMAPCLTILDYACDRNSAPRLNYVKSNAGAEVYVATGNALPDDVIELARQADAILLGAMGDPNVRYPDGTEIVPQIDLRVILGLYAGVRPVFSIPGIDPVLSDPRAAKMDFVLVRESVEGLFASRGKGTITNDREARDTMVITRDICERLFDFSFTLARQRAASDGKARVTCVDKANVFQSLAFFRKIFDERAQDFADIKADHAYVDAMALNMVRRPWDLDVMVTENMFGDILSDLGAGLMGGLGMAPSADIGDDHAVFQPCHGTAPDIAGQGKANPTAMILSGGMMLEWLGQRHGSSAAIAAGKAVRSAVNAAFADGALRSFEMGGQSGTDEIAGAILTRLNTQRQAA